MCVNILALLSQLLTIVCIFNVFFHSPSLRLQASGERTSQGDQRLFQVGEEAKKLQVHLPKAGVAQVQEHLASCQREWRSFLDGCSQSQQDLEDSIKLLKK